MPSTFFGLTIGTSALNAANVAINTTGHNVSNTNTEGYSRQYVSQSASDALRVYSSYGMVGSGVSVNSINQMRDSYYDYKYWNNNSIVGEYSSKYYYNAQIEDQYFNEMSGVGFRTYYSDFCNALDALSAQPAEEGIRNQAIQSGQSMAEFFNNLSQNLRTYQDEANMQIRTTVNRINTIAQNVAALNSQINTLELNGAAANDLRDKRNVLVDELSGLVGVTIKETESPSGSIMYTIKINNQNLVDGTSYNTLKMTARESSELRHDTDVQGLYDLSWSNGQSFDVYNEDLGGALEGYIDIRDGNNLETPDYPTDADGLDYKGIPYYTKETNEFVQEYVKQFNEIHMRGENLNRQSSEEIPFFTIKKMTVDDIKAAIVQGGIAADADAVTSEQIQNYIAENVTIENICVNPDLIADNKNLATATTIKDGVATADLAGEMAELRKKKSFGGSTAEDVMQRMVSVSGTDSSSAKNMQLNYDNIGKAIINQRLSVSGVDKDEEAIALTKYQHAYELASKVISVMNELYNKLINETGV